MTPDSVVKKATDPTHQLRMGQEKRGSSMRKITVALAVVVAAIVVPAAIAASAHWVNGPSVTISGNTLTVAGKAAGLGNTAGFADFTLTGTINVSSRCYTKSNNTPQAANKQESIDVDQSGNFPIRNGSTNVSFSVTPLSTLSCPKGQVVKIESITYDLFLNSSNFPALNTELTS
jgi:hypothetical protein